MNKIILISVSLFFMVIGAAAAGMQAKINFGGESGTFRSSGGDSEMLVEQNDGSKNLIVNKGGKVYVGHKQPGRDWSVFDPSAMGAGFTPPPQPDNEIKLEKVQKASAAGFDGHQYKVTSRQGDEVMQGQAILSASKTVRKFTEEFTGLVNAMQSSVRGGQGADGGMGEIGDYLKDRDLGMLKFWDEDGTVGFEVLSLEDGIDVGKIELPAEPSSPFGGMGDLGMGGSGQNGAPQGHVAPTQADIQKQIEELKKQFQQSQVDQADAQKQAEADRLEKERLKQQQNQAIDASAETASESVSDAAVANDSAAGPIGDDIGKKVGELLKGWGR